MFITEVSLNASKTKSMTFHRAQKKLTLKLIGQNIEMVSSFNFLRIRSELELEETCKHGYK